MDWIRSYPYAAALGSAGLLILIGSAIVTWKTGATPIHDPRVWGGNAQPLIDPTTRPQPISIPQQQYEPATDTPLYTYTSHPAEVPDDTLGISELLAALTAPKATTRTPIPQTGTYSLIPGGLISTTTRQDAKTDAQTALYNYGNEAGSHIQSYETLNSSAPQVLRNQAEDRQNEEKRAAVRAIGRALAGVGHNLQDIEDVPPAIKSAHQSLAASYIEIGTKLEKIPDANSDDAFVSAIKDYNASVELFIKRYVSLATIFSINGVTFAPYEAGSVFMFSNTRL